MELNFFSKLMYFRTIFQVGVVIKVQQPWLCGSPDGILLEEDGKVTVLEIKCPSSCEEKKIIENGKSNLKYLKLENGRVILSKTHPYYTQIQINMYVTNAKWGYLYVYSPLGSKVIVVARNETFLKNVLNKLERFYFHYYLPELTKKCKNRAENQVQAMIN